VRLLQLFPTDCDDSNDQIYPGAEEICDGLDNDCDGQIDPVCTGCFYHAVADRWQLGDCFYWDATCGGTPVFCMQDSDNDGFPPEQDCNDNNALVYPGQDEWFTSAADGSFDYDCSETVELKYTEVYDLVACTNGFLEIPDCGEDMNTYYYVDPYSTTGCVVDFWEDPGYTQACH
jgi:hypothetical protein